MEFLLALIAGLIVGGLIMALLKYVVEPRLAVGAAERQEEVDRKARERYRQPKANNDATKAAMRVALAKKTEGVQGLSANSRQDFFGNYESQLGRDVPKKTVLGVLNDFGDEPQEAPMPAPRQPRVQPVRTTKSQRKRK